MFKITTGKIKAPLFMVLHGEPGVGKSTFASKLEDPLFIDVERSSDHISTKRIDDLNSFPKVMAAIQHLRSNDVPFKTLVIDTIDSVENMLHEHICRENGWKSLSTPKWGAGYTIAFEEMRALLRAIEDLRASKGINLVVIGHSKIKGIDSPEQDNIMEQWGLRINDKVASLFRDRCEIMAFAKHLAVYVTTKDSGKAKFSYGGRIMQTSWTPQADAKSRLLLPSLMPLDAACLSVLCSERLESTVDQDVSKGIETIISNYIPKDQQEKVRASVKTESVVPGVSLVSIYNRLAKKAFKLD
jgi:hypothetical protein